MITTSACAQSKYGQAVCELGNDTGAADRVRLAILIPTMNGGGAERVALTLVDEFLAAGHEVDLVLMQVIGDLLPLVPDTVRVIDLSASRLRYALLPLIRYLRVERCAALQVSMWPLTVVAVVAHWLARSRARLVLSEHTTLSKQYGNRGLFHKLTLRGSIAAFYPKADARVAVSRQAADDLARLGGMPRESVEAIYNPILPPTQALPIGFDATSLWGERKGKRILSVGQMKTAKNHRLLIDAFARLRRDIPATLIIIGEGELRANLQAQVKSLGLIDDVLMPGFQINVWPYYASADLFVLSSDYEGFGNVLVEAMLCGVPVVSTDCESGPREILDAGRYGNLVPCGNIETLADSMKEALFAFHDYGALKARAMALSGAGSSGRYLQLMLGTGHPAIGNQAQNDKFLTTES